MCAHASAKRDMSAGPAALQAGAVPTASTLVDTFRGSASNAGPGGFWGGIGGRAGLRNPAQSLFPPGSFDAKANTPTQTLQAGGSVLNKLEGKPARHNEISQTQTNLRANITRLIVPISLPQPFGILGTRQVYRTFVSGDVVFALRATNAMLLAGNATPVSRHAIPHQMFSINLQTLNYILVNVQQAIHYAHSAATNPPALGHSTEKDKSAREWLSYAHALQETGAFDAKNGHVNCYKPKKYDIESLVLQKRWIWRFIKNFARIAGVYIGSEQQGGQHQGAPNPCSHNPTDFVGTLQTMGKYEKARNMWTTSSHNVGNGDLLGFTLKLQKESQEHMRMALSGNPSTPQDVNIETSCDYFLLVPEIYDRMLANPDEQANEITEICKSDSMLTSMREEEQLFKLTELSPGIAVHGGYFMQFAVVNEMSKGVTGTKDTCVYARDGAACTLVMNTEVLLRFTIGEPPRTPVQINGSGAGAIFIEQRPSEAKMPDAPKHTALSQSRRRVDIQGSATPAGEGSASEMMENDAPVPTPSKSNGSVPSGSTTLGAKSKKGVIG